MQLYEKKNIRRIILLDSFFIQILSAKKFLECSPLRMCVTSLAQAKRLKLIIRNRALFYEVLACGIEIGVHLGDFL